MVSSRRDVAPIWLTRTCVKPLILSRNAWHRYSQSAALMRPAWRVQHLNARPVVWLWLSLRSKTSDNNPAAAGEDIHDPIEQPSAGGPAVARRVDLSLGRAARHHRDRDQVRQHHAL